MVEMADVAGAEHAFAHHEHVELMAGLDEIRAAAELVSRARRTDALACIGHVRNWLAVTLEPHIAWEDVIIYPEIDEICGTTWPSKLMRFDHRQVRRAAHELEHDVEILANGNPTHQQRWDMQVHLLALETILRAHIDREEEVVLPALDR